ncbi:probable chitinase 10 [Topomyia yanbarensis]|uniref:probable chitinase 10 n=1 Tax=Topomyia yanbarensis TaxID=2498891 RepID=UPI00273BDED5|nr:probable chitinase 10 [Topomyia yanbarensis]
MKRFIYWGLVSLLCVASKNHVSASDNPCRGIAGIDRVPDPDDCRRYFLCIEEQAFPEECGPGLIFDVIVNQCNREEDSVCVKDLVTPPTPSISSTSTVATPPTPSNPPIPSAPTPSPQPPTSTAQPPSPQPPSPVEPPYCPVDKEFFASHPDCTRFYRCVFGRLHVQDCPPNQHWNQERQYCDHVWNVPCA